MTENVQQGLTAVGTTSVLIVPARINASPRQEIIIINTSTAAQNITLTFGQGTALYGIVLTPLGVYAVNNSAGFTVIQDDIWAVASAASGQVSVTVR